MSIRDKVASARSRAGNFRLSDEARGEFEFQAAWLVAGLIAFLGWNNLATTLHFDGSAGKYAVPVMLLAAWQASRSGKTRALCYVLIGFYAALVFKVKLSAKF